MSHAPGPWFAYNRKTSAVLTVDITDPDKRTWNIYTPEVGELVRHIAFYMTAEDAKLIAAAPNLLNALDDLATAVDAMLEMEKDEFDANMDNLEDALKNAYAVMKKVE